MADEVVLYTTTEPLDYVYGGWCRRCMLPTGVHVTVMVSIGPSSHLREFDCCTECQSFDVEPLTAPDVDHL
jgi:hypothetical protein